MVHFERSNQVLVIGGKEDSGQVLLSTETTDEELNFLDPSNGKWSQYEATGSIPERRHNPFVTAFVLNDEDAMVLWGGRTDRDGQFNTDIYLLSGSSTTSQTVDKSHPWFTLWMLHGIFMFLGWGVCLQLGALVGRYCRHKDPFWFKFHRAAQSIGLVLATVGVVLGFLSANTLAAKHFTFAHSVLGLAIMLIGWIQPLNAWIRPHPGEKYREIWSFFHKNLGRMALMAALINIALGLMMAVVVDAVWITYLVLLCCFSIVYLTLEYQKSAPRRRKTSFAAMSTPQD